MTWIYTFPTWLFAPLVVAVACTLAGGGLLLVRRFGTKADRITHNDVAGPIIGTAGTILAVVLSFMVVVVWQEYDASAGNVQREASAVADLHHLVLGFPVPLRGQVQRDLDRYTDTIITDEWPLMQHGGRSTIAKRLAYNVEHDVVAFVPATLHEDTLQGQALELVRTFADARRQRLFDNDQGIPPLMWTAMLVLSIITVGFTYLFRVDNIRAHLIMTIGLSAIVAVIFVLIAELDYPFRGDIRIGPDAFAHVQATIHEVDYDPAKGDY
ncbi:MAG: DUF4239 domain-containing protein [Candidatus Eremiobacteraeota bacterium]|nr:DUF4239 domain-containing protein [Candidatus Eremiobacteraeota bacterium]